MNRNSPVLCALCNKHVVVGCLRLNCPITGQDVRTSYALRNNKPLDGVHEILEERGGLEGRGKYGPFVDNATIAQELKYVMHRTPNWDKLGVVRQEALDLIAMKVSRILSGDPKYSDNWDDIAGYCMLAKHDWEKDA